VQFFAGLHGLRPSEGRARFDELLERFGLQDKRDVEVRKLSHGMKQKTSVVCALARRTPLVFLDEPTLGLDVETSLELRNTLREYATNEGRTVVVSSHDMDVIQDLCGRVIILSRGRVVTDDSVDHLRRLFRTRTCGIRLGAAPEAADAEGLAAELGARFAPADVSGVWVRATLSGGDDIYELMDLLRARRLAIEEVTYEAPDLEQVFLEVVRRANGVKQAEGAGVEG
ncbi:MAG: ABC transporter ATP-binding protein, partial [Bacillota bacterium]